MKKSEDSLYLTFLRSAVLTGIVSGVIGLMFAFQSSRNYFNSQELSKDHNYAIVVSSLIIPSMAISNYREIQNTLGRLNNEFYEHAVIDSEGEIILADFTTYQLVKAIVPQKPNILCKNFPKFAEFKFPEPARIICIPLNTQLEAAATGQKDLGLLIIFRRSPKEKISMYQFLFASSVLILTIILTLIILQSFAKRKMINPLKKLIVDIEDAKDNKTFDFKNINIGDLPLEYKSIINHFQDLHFLLASQQIEKSRMEKETAQVKLATRLAHDIRSPLAALKVVKDIGSGNLEPDVAKLLSMSIDRITDIANTILPKKIEQTENKEEAQTCFLWMLVDQIISEKRVEYKNSNDISIDFNFDGSPFDLNAFCNATEFMRSISNIINNSIEAKDPTRKLNIRVKLNLVNDSVVLKITDNGKGMTLEVLSKSFSEGFTHGKSHGTGLGLYQVKKAVESWDGKISIESQTNIGTSISIALKKSPQPAWLINSINISKYQNIIVLDDDEYVFSILQDRFEKYFSDIRYFKKIIEFEQHIQTSSRSLLFIDHDLKQNMSGIDLIQKYNLQSHSILVTGNYDDKQVQQKALELGIKILPKPLINDISIT